MSQCSSGKRVRATARDLLWFSKLAEHGPLPSSFLLGFAPDSHQSEKRAQERLTDLFHETDTPHEGAYLLRPPQQFRTIDSRYNQLVYDLDAAAMTALAERDSLARRTQSGPWLHSFMVSCITASIELACISRADVSFVPQSQILKRASAELRYSVTVVDPATGRSHQKDLLPDAIFGLEYRTQNSRKFRFFVVEADRATEPATSTNFHRKSFQRHLLQYAQYVERGLYRQHLRLTAPLLVLNVTSDSKRMAKMMKVTDRHFPQGNSYQLFQCWESFGPVFSPPNPHSALLSEKWERAGLSSSYIGLI